MDLLDIHAEHDSPAGMAGRIMGIALFEAGQIAFLENMMPESFRFEQAEPLLKTV